MFIEFKDRGTCSGKKQERSRSRSITQAIGLGIKEITSESDLRKAINKGVWLIAFSTPWCSPCRLQEPIMHRLEHKFQGKALLGTLNIDQSPETASDLGIHSIPTLVIFRNNKEIQRFIGLQSEETLSEALQKLIHNSG